MILVLIMLARWIKCAFRAPIIIKEISLQVDGRVFELFKAFVFQELPHLFFGDSITFFDKFSLFFIEYNGPAQVTYLFLLPMEDLVKLNDPIWAFGGSK